MTLHSKIPLLRTFSPCPGINTFLSIWSCHFIILCKAKWQEIKAFWCNRLYFHFSYFVYFHLWVFSLVWIAFSFLYWSVIRVDDAEVIADWNYSVALKVLIGVFQKCGDIWEWSYILVSLTRPIDLYKYISSLLYFLIKYMNTWKKKNLKLYKTEKFEWLTSAAIPGHELGNQLPGNPCWLSVLSSWGVFSQSFFKNQPLIKYLNVTGHHWWIIVTFRHTS